VTQARRGPSSRPARGSAQAGAGSLRIVGGQWRGRRLPIADLPGLRPTPDRVRETLFNWLMPILPGARCLDLFAGTGALGLEALSRGAGEAVLVERSEMAARQIGANLLALGAEHAELAQSDALDWLEGSARAFDIVFLDPPFATEMLAPACERLAQRGWLAPSARVYLECSAKTEFPSLPHGWDLLRERTAGAVRFGLALA
jgi:16S rRNA (guanine966-N2)-methyltransferase